VVVNKGLKFSIRYMRQIMTHSALLWETNVQMLAIAGGKVSPLDALQAMKT
jgi:hypothetical protein